MRIGNNNENLEKLDILAVAEIAELLKVSTATVYLWIRKGFLKAKTSHRRKLILVELNEFLKFQEFKKTYTGTYFKPEVGKRRLQKKDKSMLKKQNGISPQNRN